MKYDFDLLWHERHYLGGRLFQLQYPLPGHNLESLAGSEEADFHTFEDQRKNNEAKIKAKSNDDKQKLK